eukprot:TRINITY_DN1999_c0_g1_i2.p1 TRINITY_DN1999_c0_g1~~TRINITY_DN1999_c0_g1_i2.p1  ORF type:complete len:316 (+),score=69.20 TRINITY_DN1999_c0_g1_i2:720-1667(+)
MEIGSPALPPVNYVWKKTRLVGFSITDEERSCVLCADKKEEDRVYQALFQLHELLRWIKSPATQPFLFRLLVRMRNFGRFPQPAPNRVPLLVFDEVQNLHTPEHEVSRYCTQSPALREEEDKIRLEREDAYQLFHGLAAKIAALTQDSRLARVLLLSSSVHLREQLQETPLYEHVRRVDVDVLGFDGPNAIEYLVRRGLEEDDAKTVVSTIGTRAGLLHEFSALLVTGGFYESSWYASFPEAPRVKDMAGPYDRMALRGQLALYVADKQHVYKGFVQSTRDNMCNVQKHDAGIVRAFLQRVADGMDLDRLNLNLS